MRPRPNIPTAAPRWPSAPIRPGGCAEHAAIIAISEPASKSFLAGVAHFAGSVQAKGRATRTGRRAFRRECFRPRCGPTHPGRRAFRRECSGQGAGHPHRPSRISSGVSGQGAGHPHRASSRISSGVFRPRCGPPAPGVAHFVGSVQAKVRATAQGRRAFRRECSAKVRATSSRSTSRQARRCRRARFPAQARFDSAAATAARGPGQ
jgi:hypothetical protein